jgi:hypothetical protein
MVGKTENISSLDIEGGTVKVGTIIISALLFLLSGCVGISGMMGGHVNAYEGPEKPDSEVATLVCTQNPDLSGNAFLSKVDEETYGDDLFRGFPRVVKILPGKHKITVKCLVSNKYAFPAVTGLFEAGRYYELTCNDVGRGYAKASIVDHGTTNILSPTK